MGRADVSLSCEDCDWSLEYDGDFYAYCPECGSGVDIGADFEAIEESEQQTARI